MTAKIINGTEIASQIKEELRQEIIRLKYKHNLVPGLATVLVGNDPASQVYVNAKVKACEALGIHSIRYDLISGTNEATLLALVNRLNKDHSAHGILVQLPLPENINESNIILAIDSKKDVDCFHPANVGRLVMGNPIFLPCTPHGIQELLLRTGVEIEGADVVVVGRSNIVGKPVANMLLQKKVGANATVTVCHTRTRDLASHTRRADILIVAAGGKPKAITADMVKEGAVVIDVGTHRIGETATGKSILCGDVDFDSVKEKASAITPVPGGVGPMTIAMLMSNTVKAAKMATGLD